MTEHEKKQELIEAYLAKRLEQEELSNFEQRLKDDPTFAQEVDLHKELETALGDEDTFSLESTLLEIRSEMEEGEEDQKDNSSTKVVSLYRRFRTPAIAAAVALLAGLFYILMPSEPDLYSQHFEPYPNYLTTRSAEADNKELLNASSLQYSNLQFEEALKGFQQLLETNPNQYDLVFYSGMSQLQLNQLAAATQSFQQVIQHGDNNFVAPAQWYLALTQVKAEQYAAAQTTLTSIVERNGDYAEKARALVASIDKEQ